MALSESIEYDKIEVVGQYDNLVDNPLDKEPDGTTAIADEVKAVCTAVWTTAIKNAWKTQLIADKTS